jgi:hypothetical protein
MKFISGTEAGVCARMDENGNGYCFSTSWGGGYRVMLSKFRDNNQNPKDINPGTEIILRPNVPYDIKLRVSGNELKGKIWKDGTSEPELWTATAVDNDFSEGAPGFYSYGTVPEIISLKINGVEAEGATDSEKIDCMDSDGDNIYVKGNIVLTNENGSVKEMYDACSSIEGNSSHTGIVSCQSSSTTKCAVIEMLCDGSGIGYGTQLVCPNGCSNGACLRVTNTTTAKVLPPLTIAVYDNGPPSDINLAVAIGSEINFAYRISASNISVGAAKLFSEVNGLQLDNKITLVICGNLNPENKAIIVVGSHSPPEDVAFCTNVLSQILFDKKVNQKTIVSDEIKSSNLVDLCKDNTSEEVIPEENKTEQPKLNDLCNSNSDCDDSDPCTSDICSGSPKQCSNNVVALGCSYNDACIPIGTRVQSQYCDIDKNMKQQKSEELLCSNSFECGTNLCVNDKCVSPNVIQKILKWFGGLFGGNNDVIVVPQEPKKPESSECNDLAKNLDRSQPANLQACDDWGKKSERVIVGGTLLNITTTYNEASGDYWSVLAFKGKNRERSVSLISHDNNSPYVIGTFYKFDLSKECDLLMSMENSGGIADSDYKYLEPVQCS